MRKNKGQNKIKGPDKSAFYAAILLISVPVVLFFVFVCPHLVARLGVTVVVVPVYAVIVCLASLFVASAVDPGVIPRSTAPQREGEETKKIETVLGQPVPVRWCSTCRIIRPPRASHCSDCDRCVEKFDHHCPWVGNCIGKRNYRYFVIFLLSCTFLCAYLCSFSVLRLVWLAQENPGFVNAVLTSPISLILTIYTFFIFWSVGGLFAYHQYLTSIALTTHEEMKSTFSSKSPYSEGYLINFVSVWCPPCYPSYYPSSYGSRAGGLLDDLDVEHADRERERERENRDSIERGHNNYEEDNNNDNDDDDDMMQFNKNGKNLESLPLKYGREEV